jgi:uncharacterized protein
MKRILAFTFLLLSYFAQGQIETVVPARPSPPRLVNDLAHILSPEQQQALESKLVAYDDSTSNQIAIVTLPTLTDAKTGTSYTDEEVALKILREWGVGNKEKNNGIVVLIVKSADNKEKAIRIEVGYGLEGAVPDITASHIIEEDITPAFKAGDFYSGLDQGTDHLIQAAAGEYKAPEGYHKNNSRHIPIGTIIFIVILIISFISRGGRNGGMMSRRGYRGFGTGWILGSMLGGGGWGGGSGGGGFGGGGGGFGGFGGGSGGGGGASGSW